MNGVFLLSRIKEEHDRTGDNIHSVAFGLERTGGLVTALAALLAVVFIAFAISKITFIKLFGIGLAMAVLVDATIIVYFIPFLYMYASAIKLAYAPDRATNPHAVLIPGGKAGVWIAGILGFSVTLLSIIVAVIPTEEVQSVLGFELKLVGTTVVAIAIGLALYWRGAKAKSN